MGIHVLDCIFVVLILYGVLAGLKKGLIASVGAIVSFVLGIGAAILFWESATDYLQSHYSLVTFVANFLSGHLPVPVFDDIGGMTSTLFKSSLYAYQGLIYHIARLLVSGLVFILILFLVTRVLGIVWHILSMVFGWGILGMGNRIGGAAFESLKVTLVLSILAGLTMPVVRSLSNTGFPAAIDLNAYLDRSFLLPCLEGIFQIMGKIIGIQSGHTT
ncbi:MAG: CvpA family protein [Syntrophomonadales bacterium]|jgi:hypothetical protein